MQIRQPPSFLSVQLSDVPNEALKPFKPPTHFRPPPMSREVDTDVEVYSNSFFFEYIAISSPTLYIKPVVFSVPCWNTLYVALVAPSNLASPLLSNLIDRREPERVQDVNRRSCFSTIESRIRLWHHSRTGIRVCK